MEAMHGRKPTSVGVAWKAAIGIKAGNIPCARNGNGDARDRMNEVIAI